MIEALICGGGANTDNLNVILTCLLLILAAQMDTVRQG